MNDTKVKAFVARIVEECEQEGFTVAEALSIPQALRFALNHRADEIQRKVDLNGLRVEQGTHDKDADIHQQTH